MSRSGASLQSKSLTYGVKTQNFCEFYKNSAKIDAPATVSMPLTTMDKLLIAPSTAPISIAFAVPTAWDDVPMAMPLAMGSLMRMSLRNFSAKILPSTPVMMIETTDTLT